MTLSNYFSFFVLVLAIVYSPGPMTMFLMAKGMKMQYQKIWPILIGANNAYLISIIVFSVGLTEVLQQNMTIFKVIQVGGIIYLFYLAFTQWNKKINLNITITTLEDSERTSSLYAKGALVALANPKAIIMFSIIFPQFTSGVEHKFLQIIICGLTFLVLQFSSGCVYAYFGKRIKIWMDKPFYQNLINKVQASVLAMVGLFLIMRL